MRGLIWMSFLGSGLASVIANREVYEYVTHTVRTTTYVCPTSTSIPTALQTSTGSGNGASNSTQDSGTSLEPSTYYDIDLTDLNNLVPSDNTQLYYTPNGTFSPDIECQFALLTANHTYPAVVLEHSEYISDVQCVTAGLYLSFSTSAAFEAAQNSWNLTFILVTHTSGCDAANSTAERAFFLVENVTFDNGSLSVSLEVVEIGLEGAVTDITINYGTYLPGGNGTADGVNTTSTGSDSSVDLGCAAPPSSEIDGFPTAPCGSSFDTELDLDLGYLNFTTDDFSASLQSAAPGIGYFNVTDYQDDDIVGENNTAVERRAAAKVAAPKSAPAPPKSAPATSKVATNNKAASAPALGQKVAATVKKNDILKPVAATAKTQASTDKTQISKGITNTAGTNSQLLTNIVKAGAAAVPAVVGAVGTLSELLKDPSFSESIDINLTPANATVPSPFGDSVELFKQEKTGDGPTQGAVGIYCTGCGVTGKLHYAGAITFSLSSPFITSATASINGNLQAVFNVGLMANGSYKQSFEKILASKSYGKFDIKNVLVFEPITSFSAQLDMDVQSSGTLQTNVSLSIPNFGASIDLVSGKNSKAAGFLPAITQSVEPTGEITATAGISLPISIGVGISIVPLKGNGNLFVNLINKPSITTHSSYVYSATTPDTTCNNGVTYALNLTDTTTLDLAGVIFPLDSYTPISTAPGCKQLAPGGTNTPATIAPGTVDTAGTGGTTLTGATDGSGGIGQRDVPNNSSATTQTPASATETPYSAPTDTVFDTADGDTAVTDDGDFLADEALADSAESTDPDTPNEDGFTYVDIYDSSGTYLLFNDADGNFGLTTANSSTEPLSFGAYENITVTDDNGRAMFYYPDVMDKYGVSRFRMNDYDHIPTTADFITLTPINDDGSDSTPGVYVAVDTSGDVFFTVVCLLQNQQAKIFLVKDLDAGVAALTSGDLEYTVTGGVATYCSPMDFVSDGTGIN